MKNLVLSFVAFIAFSISAFSQQTIQNAIDKTDTRFVKEWIQQGHDVNGFINVDNQNYTPLSYASLKANPEMVTLLLNKGAQVNLKIDFQDALMYAAMGGNVEIIEKLLAAGANPMNENKMGKCSRDLAKDNGHVDAQRLLTAEIEKRIAAIRAQKRK